MEISRNFHNYYSLWYKIIKSYIYKKTNKSENGIDIHYSTYNKFIKLITDEYELNPIDLQNFNFTKQTEAICNLIRNTDQKFSIGIYGSWGTGKTTLMKLIEKELNKYIFLFSFSWKNVTLDGNDSYIVKEFLKNTFEINWIVDQKFVKNKNNKRISISNLNHSISFILNNEDTKLILNIDNKHNYEFHFRRNELDIIDVYQNNILTVWFNAWRYEREDQFALVALMKTIAYAMGDNPFFKEVRKILLRGFGILGKDMLRHFALQYIMTEKGFENIEKKTPS